MAINPYTVDLGCGGVASLFTPTAGGNFQQAYVNNPRTEGDPIGSTPNSAANKICVADDYLIFGPVAANTAYSVPASGVLINDKIASPPSIKVIRESKPSNLGAAVEIYPDGSFHYDGTAVQAFRQMQANQSVLDWFDYTATLSDGQTGRGRVTLKVEGRNDPPQLIYAHNTTVDEAGSFVLGSNLLKAEDVDNSISQIIFEVSQTPQHGRLENRNQPGVPISSFTQADVDAQLILYQNDGSDFASDSIALAIVDSQGARAANRATIDIAVTTINDPPYLTNALPSYLTATEDIPSPLDLQFLDIKDPDAGTNPLTVKLTVVHGQLTAVAGANLIISGSGTNQLTINGSIPALRAYFASQNSVQFLGDLNLSGDGASNLAITVNDNGNTGLGGPQIVSFGPISINVTAENDAPENTGSLPAIFTVDVGVASPLDLSSVILFDSDAGNQDVVFKVHTTSGVLISPSSSQVVVTGSNSATVSLRGSLPALNAYLQNTSNFQLLVALGNAANGIKIQLTANDLGHTGAGGGNDVSLGTVPVDVTTVNDPPSNAGTLPTSITIIEDTSTNLDLHSVEVLDVDNGSGNLTLTLTATNATLTATSTSSVTVTGSGTTSISLVGTQASLNAYLDQIPNMQILGDLNVSGMGAASIAVTASDGFSSVPFGTVTVNITPVNDPPTNAGSLPTTVTIVEDVWSPINLSLIHLADVDIGNGNLTVTLTATNATLKGNPGTGVTITGNTTNTINLTGTLTNLNNYLDILSHIQLLGAPNLYGVAAASLSVAVSDASSTTQLGNIQVDITPVNDAPTFTGTLTTPITAAEDTPTNLDLSSITISDVDIGSSNLTVIFSANNATVTAASASGITIAGSGTANLSLSGTLTAINSYLHVSSNLQVLGALNLYGTAAASVAIAASDGQATSQLGTVVVNITPVNDAPANTGTLPSSITITEDVPSNLNLSSVNIADVDIGSGNVIVTLTATHATLQATPTTGVTVGGNLSATLTLTGTLAAINAYLDVSSNIKVQGDLNLYGTAAASVSMAVSDGQATTQFGTIQIDITPVNDAPTNTGALPTVLTAIEDVLSNMDLSLINLADVDIGSGNLTLTLTATNATLHAAASAGITIVGNDSATLSLTGTPAALNAYLDVVSNIQLLGAPNLYGPAAASISLADSDGSSSVQLGTIPINITPVNDAPVNTGSLPGTITIFEDVPTNLNLSAINIADVDIGSGNLTVTLTATNATLHANASAGITISGNNSGALSLTGSLTAINAYLDNTTNLQVQGALNVNGPGAASLSIAASDASATSQFGTVLIDITPVNDPPTNTGTLPTALTAVEDVLSYMDLSSVNLADVDIGSSDMTFTLTATDATLHAAASAGITITGNHTGTLSLTGTVVALNTYLDNPTNLQILGAPDLYGIAAASISVSDSDGSSSVQLGTIQINITPVNDPPTNTGTLPSTITIIEDVPANLNLSSINLADVDIGTGNLTLTLTATNASVHATTSAGITINGNNSGTVSLTGTVAALNAYLDVTTNLQVQGAPNVNGTAAASLAVAVGDGSSLSQLGTIQIDITAVNDSPTNTGSLPSTITGIEDVLSNVDLSLINLSDVDIGSGNLTVTLTATNATLHAATAAGITIGGNHSAVLTLTGTPAALNAYLDVAANLQLLGYPDLYGPAAASISIAVDDGTSTTQLGTVQVDLTAVNDPPTNTGSLPSSLTIVEDIATNLNLSSINLSDVDIGTGSLTVTLTASHATVHATTSAGITINGNDSGAVSLTGTLAALNAYLDVISNLQVQGAQNLNGPAAASLSVAVSDGTATTQLGSIQIDITAVDDSPVNSGSLPTTITVTEDVLSNVDLSSINITDPDIGAGNLTFTLTATNATLQGNPGTGVTVTGNSTSSLTLTGTLADLNTYLDVLSHVQLLGAPNLYGVAAASLSVAVSDGSSTTQLGNIQVNITPVNDAPTFTGTLSTPISAVEDVPVNLDLSNISISDVDIGSGNLTVTFSANNATVTATSVSGITIAGSGTASLSLTGNLTDINNYLHVSSNLQLLGAPNLNGTAAASVAIAASDGQATSPLGTVVVNITPVNDPPVNTGTLPASVTVIEDVPANLDLSSVNIADVDIGSGNLIVTLAATNATLQANTISGVTVGGNHSATLTLTGTLAAINAYLDVSSNIQVQGDSNLNGSNAASVSMAVSDGQATSQFGTIQINITPVNDAPVNTGTLPTVLTAIEDVLSNLDLSLIHLTDVDIGTGNLTITLTATNATLSATASAGIAIAGNHTAILSLTGTPDALNAYLDIASNVQLLGSPDLSGPAAASISVATSDGSLVSQLGTVQIDITAVNDAPTNSGSLPGTITLTEDVAANLNLSAINIADVDIGTGNLTVTLTATNATVHANASAGVTISGNDSGALSLTGTLTAINAYLDNTSNLQILGALNVNGIAAASLAVAASDSTSTTQIGTVQINITAVNDPPTNTGSLPTTVTGIEDVLSPINLSLIHLADPDIGSGNLTVTLTATHATLQAASAAGIAIVGNGTGTVTLTGTMTDLNTYLDVINNIQLLGAPNLSGTAAASLSVAVGDGSVTTQLGTIQVDLTDVDDPPGNSGTLPDTINIFEDLIANFDISSVDLSTVNPSSSNLTVTLTATHATLHATASAGISIGGNHTNTLTLDGTVYALNAYLDIASNLQILGDLNLNGINAANVAVSVSDGVLTTPLGTVQINITAVNDPPTNAGTLPASFTAIEDVPSNIDLSSIDVADVDIGSGNLTLTLRSTHATLQATTSAGITLTGSGTSTLSIAGSLTALNAYLNQSTNVQLLGDSNLNGNGAASVSFALSDGLSSVQLGTVPVNITPVNDPPINTGSLYNTVTFIEDTAANLDLSAINLADADIGSGNLTLTLTATNATLHAAASAGITITGNDSGTLSLTGTLTALNWYLDMTSHVQLQGALNVNGPAAASVSVAVSDGMDTTQLGTIHVDITAVNDAPTNLGALPSAVTAVEDVATAIDLSQINLADVDIGSGNMTFTLIANNATLQATASAGIVIGGNGTGILTLTGTLTALNAYLDVTTNLSVLGASNLNGTAAASLSASVSDGLSTTQLGTIQVDITAVNDPPFNKGTLPSVLFGIEDTLANLNLSTVVLCDVDVGSGNLTLTITATNATLQASALSGIAISGGGSSSLSLTGTVAALNAYLAVTNRLQVLGNLNLNGTAAASLSVAVSDGLSTTPLGNIQVDLAAVNDAPINLGSLPSVVSGVEDTLATLDLSLINLDDVDIGSGNLTVTLTATNATLQATSAAGISISGNGTALVALTGTLANLNAYLDVTTNLQVLGASNLNGVAAASVSVAVSDGSSVTPLGSVQIDLTAVNDPPINSGGLPSTITAIEDVLSPLNLSLINLSDVDIGSGNLTVTLTATNATLQATASAGISISGSGTSTVSLTCTLVALNAYLDVITNLQLLGSPNLNGTAAASVSVAVSDGSSTTPLGNVQVDITAVNDPPTNTGSLPALVTGVEDTLAVLDLSLINLSDVDIGSGNMTVTLTATNATLQAAASAGISVTGDGTAVLSLTGTMAALNAYLDITNNLHVLGNLNLNGIAAASVSVAVSDGSTTTPLGNVQIDLTAVNDAPINTGSLPSVVTGIEDVLSYLNLSLIHLSDVDIGSGNLVVTLTATNATLQATASAGISIGGNGTATVTLTGTQTALNAYLDIATNLQLLGAPNLNGTAAASVSVAVSDGSSTTQLGSVQIDLTAVNDPPTNTGSLPSVVTGVEDVLSALNLSAINLSDVDIGSGNLTLTLTATNATLQATASAGIAISGNGTATVTLTGTQTALNAYLDVTSNLQVLGALNLNGTAAASVSVAVSDGSSTTPIGTVQVDLTAVNDPPTNTGSLPSVVTGIEDVLSPLNLSLIHLADVDIGSGNLTVTLTATNATLQATASAGISIGGNGTATVTLTGTQTALNAYLDVTTNLQLLGALNLNGTAAASVSVAVSDGSSTTPLGTVQVDLTAVNDPPVNTGSLPSVVTGVEDVLSALNLSLINLTDVDIGSGNLTVTLAATNATLQAAASAGITISGNGTASLSLTGTLTALNAYLDVTTNLKVLGALNLNGIAAASVSVAVSDGSSTTQLGTVQVDITAVNDAPTNTGSLPSVVTGVEDVLSPLNLSLIHLSDVDIGSGNLTVTLTGTNTTLQATAAAGISITGSGTSTVTLTGTQTALNTYLDVATNLNLLGALNLNGTAAASVSVAVSDGSLTTQLGSVQIDLTAVNDAPTNTGSLPSLITGVEDVLSTLNLSLINLNDVDIGSGNLTVTLAATNATLQAAASAGIAISGNGTATVTLTGTQAALNAYLDVTTNLQVLGALNLNGTAAASVSVSVSDGSLTTPLGSVQVDITAVNDAPTNIGSLPSIVTGVEDVLSSLNLSLINLSDVDIGSGNLTVTLTAINATLQATAAAGISISGNGMSTLSLTGTQTALNNYLDVTTNLLVLGALNLNGTAAASVSVAVSDGLLTTQLGSVQVDLTAVNDPPTNTGSLPSVITGIEDVLSTLNLSVINLNDVDIGNGNLTVTLTASNATLQATASAGITISGNGTSTISLTGTQAALNAYLDVTTNLQVLGTLDLNGIGAASVAVAVSDGSSTTQLGAVQINLTAVNDAPVNTGSLPTNITGVEDVLSPINLSLINISDVDIGSGNLTVTLTATNSTLQALPSAGIAINGNGTGTVTLTGTQTALNAYLDVITNVQLLGTLNLNGIGAASVSVAVSDGLATTQLGSVQVDLTAVNDAPTVVQNVPLSLSLVQGLLTTLNLTTVTISDVDVGSAPMTMTLTAQLGVFAATSFAGLTITGSGTKVLTLTGSISTLNTYLSVLGNLKFTSLLGLLGLNIDTISLRVSDNGNTGTGGPGIVNFATININGIL